MLTCLTHADIARGAMSRHVLRKGLASGEWERVAPGVFLRAGFTDDTTATRIALAIKRPQATLCGLTAAAHHDLVDEIPGHTDIAIPRGVMPVRTRLSPVEWHSFAVNTFPIGRDRLELPCGQAIGLYSPERTLVDMFRLRHLWGADIAHTSLKTWLARPGASPAALLACADHFPRARPALQQALEILL